MLNKKMKSNFKKVIIFQEFNVGGAKMLNKNLHKINFRDLSTEDRQFIQNCLQKNTISAYSSELIQTELREGFSQAFYRQFDSSRQKAAKFEFSRYNNFNYRFANKQKSCFRGCVKKTFRFIYNLAKISVLLLIAILTYLLIALSKLKWPKAGDKDKSKCDDDPDAPGCCSCEEIKEKSESMKDRIRESIRNAEAQASKGRGQNMAQIATIGALLSVPFAHDTRAHEEKELVDSMSQNLSKIETKIGTLRNTHLFGCDCKKIDIDYYNFNKDIDERLIEEYGPTVNTSMRLIDKINKYTNHLKSKAMCDNDFGESLTNYTASVAEAIYTDPSRLFNR